MVYKAVVAGLETTKLFTGFMHRSGTLRNLPASWKDVWFENNWDKPGS